MRAKRSMIDRTSLQTLQGIRRCAPPCRTIIDAGPASNKGYDAAMRSTTSRELSRIAAGAMTAVVLTAALFLLTLGFLLAG